MIVNRTKEGSKEGRGREKGTGYRTVLLTPELRSRLLELFGEHFFLWIVTSEANIYRHRIEEWVSEEETFRNDLIHARQKEGN